jgi:hypothetical protein
MDVEKVCDALVEVAPPHLARRYSRNCCIAATRVGIYVLEHLGVAAIAVPVLVTAVNKTWLKMSDKQSRLGRPLSMNEWLATNARIVQIDGKSDAGGWPGHLVVGIPSHNLIVDLTTRQFSRPDMAIPDAGVFRCTPPWFDDVGTVAVYETLDGSQIAYRRFEPSSPYQSTPDWKKKTNWFGAARDMLLEVEGRLK